MVVLALETATRQGSVALWIDGRITARQGDPQRTHGERLPTELLDWLAEHERTVRDVDLYAVVSGPGSFTGLRVGMAAIQGLALAMDRRVVPIPTLEAMAGLWIESHRGDRRVIVACLDGQRGDVFVAAYAGGPDQTPASHVWLEPSVGSPEAMAAPIGALRQPVVLIGNGARRYASIFESHLPGIEIADVPAPLAQWAAKQAAGQVDAALPPHALRPIYIRRPDAELARDRLRGGLPSAAVRIVVRRASTPSDLSAVDRLQRQTFTNPWGVDALRWELEHTDVARLYVAEAPSGEVVAYCACWMVFDELHINSLAVDEAWRQRGIARRLLVEVLEEAVRAGARSATLEVRESNVAARKLYEGLGFRIEATRRDYYQHPREDALVLWNRQLGT